MRCFGLVCVLAAATAVSIVTTDFCSIMSSDEGLHVDCSHRQLTSLPVTWPDQVVWLDLSHNNLSELTQVSFSEPHLSYLRHLDLSYNQLNGTLANNTFATLGQLTWLSLHGNHLEGLGAGAMVGLGQLTFLDLSHNHILLDNDTYPPGVFQPLASLRQLMLAGNDDRLDGDYPWNVFSDFSVSEGPSSNVSRNWPAHDCVWANCSRRQPDEVARSGLASLEVLSIDTFLDTDFGSAFKGLVSLKTLKLDINCKLKHVRNTTLAAFRNSSLEELLLNAKQLVAVELCAFCHLPKLRKLSINNAFLPVTDVTEALYGLQNQTMSEIDFTGIQTTGYTVTFDDHVTRYMRTICVSRVRVSNTMIQRVTSTSCFDPTSNFVRCLEEIDISRNRLVGDRTAFLKLMIVFKSLRRVDFSTQYVYSLERDDEGLTEDRMMKFSGLWNHNDAGLTFTVPENLTYVNVSTALPRWGIKYDKINFVNGGNIQTVDISYSWMRSCLGSPVGLTSLETLDMSGNYCYNISETIFDRVPTLLHLRLSKFHINRKFFRERAWRLFLNLPLLQTLDLSYNDLIDIDPNMLRAQRQLRELNLAGNRLQTLSLDVSVHAELRLLDLTNNMLPTLLAHERQALDALADTHGFTLRLHGNPLLCACSNLDMVRWLWMTSVRLDGDGGGANYMCVTETGEASDTASVMTNYYMHWRRCVGQRILGAATATFLLLSLALVLVYIVSCNWTHLAYAWKVMRRLRLPRRAHFRRDAYVGYADADWELACVTLPDCLGERHGVRLLVRAFEEVPGCVRAEGIVQHIDDSWKVLLLVTPAFATDEWLCGFTVQQAQRSITDTMPDRVIVVLLEDLAHLPPMASLERLLRMVPETNVFHVHKDAAPADPVWGKLANAILGEEIGR